MFQSIATEFVDLNPIIPVSDVAETIEFYESKLGFTCLTPFRPGEHILYAVLKRDSIVINFNYFEGEQLRNVERPHLRIQVRNIEPFFDDLKIKGALETGESIDETAWDTKEFVVYDNNRVKFSFYEDLL